MRRFDDAYWVARDDDGAFPRNFHRAMADAGWLGITLPTEYGGAGLNTTAITTFAQKVPGGYVVHGQKVWTSTAQVAGKIMLLTRTTKLEDCARPTDGITIFYTDLDRSKIEVHRIPKMGRKAVDSNAIFIDGCLSPRPTASAKRARASATSCTA